MAILKYAMNAQERAMMGYSEAYVMKSTDFVINATTTHVICPLNAGDIVIPQFMVIDVRTAVAGPTCTATLGVTGTVNRWIAATSIATVTQLTPTITAVAAASDFNTRWQPYASAGSENLVAQMVVSNVALTAGEVWFWFRIFRNSARNAIRL